MKSESSNWVVLGEPLEAAAKVTLDYKAPIAALIMIAMIVMMVVDSIPVAPVTAVLLAAVMMVVTGCVRSVEAAYKTINWQTIVLFAAMLPMSIALEKTGVSEMISGIDLVKAQIRIAAGDKLKIRQKDVEFRGHAIECRINAEDPKHGFAPFPGVVTLFSPPGGPNVRVDSHVYSGYRIPAHYDSLTAKMIVWGENRAEAIACCRRAIDEVIVQGVKTTLPFQKLVLNNKSFVEGKYDTGFVENMIQETSTSAKKEN